MLTPVSRTSSMTTLCRDVMSSLSDADIRDAVAACCCSAILKCPYANTPARRAQIFGSEFVSNFHTWVITLNWTQLRHSAQQRHRFFWSLSDKVRFVSVKAERHLPSITWHHVLRWQPDTHHVIMSGGWGGVQGQRGSGVRGVRGQGRGSRIRGPIQGQRGPAWQQQRCRHDSARPFRLRRARPKKLRRGRGNFVCQIFWIGPPTE